MRIFLIGLVFAALLGMPALSANPDGSVTPLQMYGQMRQQAKVIAQLQKNVALHNRFWNDVDTQDSVVSAFKRMDERLGMLEKKVTHLTNIVKLLQERVSTKADK